METGLFDATHSALSDMFCKPLFALHLLRFCDRERCARNEKDIDNKETGILTAKIHFICFVSYLHD